MLNKRFIISFLTICLLSSYIYAKQVDDEKGNKKRDHKDNNSYQKNKDYNDKKIKYEKQKDIPHGLQKKVNNGGTLPPGWQKKIEKGQFANSDILSNGRIVTSKYPRIKNTEVYEVENKVFRIYKDTREILDILK
ncbi:hypothetical protein [Aliarcobacter cryaerophilus]|uniref:RcnB family protein n=1 Tax=Aliarcobacter cryaerophilus TaxID=28198 RepID=A0A2S9SVQ6_9BACT|nr:hypothetical protein [Aliarcobacter cryaerophilus]PRM90680.1 hypothetical protein CJ671_01055 [Aliarcobacter cryaerophilus]PRM98566.1 hypothetical protein CJ670_03025 [Arcobacter cryaerophilus gv. crypticus]